MGRCIERSRSPLSLISFLRGGFNGDLLMGFPRGESGPFTKSLCLAAHTKI
jgi:hypothetical protein